MRVTFGVDRCWDCPVKPGYRTWSLVILHPSRDSGLMLLASRRWGWEWLPRVKAPNPDPGFSSYWSWGVGWGWGFLEFFSEGGGTRVRHHRPVRGMG